MDERNMLEEAICAELEKLKECVDTEERRKMVVNIVDLYGVKIADDKAAAEADVAYISQKATEKVADREYEQKSEQAKQHKIDLLIEVSVQVGLALATMISYDIWHKRGLRFEEHGTITAPETRNLLNNMLPKRK